MSNEIQTKLDALQGFTITLAALANNAARQSTMIANTNRRPAAMIYLEMKSGAVAPTAGSVVEVYLLRGDGASYRTDAAGAVDAAITIINAQLLGTIVTPATADFYTYGEFDTAPLGPLGVEFGIAIKNVTGQALAALEENFTKKYALYLPEIQ